MQLKLGTDIRNTANRDMPGSLCDWIGCFSLGILTPRHAVLSEHGCCYERRECGTQTVACLHKTFQYMLALGSYRFVWESGKCMST
jgi:hypothetical protein